MKTIEDVYELSPLQQGILFHHILNPASEGYFQQLSLRLRGPLRPVLYQQAWQQLVDRHPILRTSFHWEELDKPVQVVRRGVELPWEYHDWQEWPPAEQAAKLAQLLKAERSRQFQLSEAPAMRCILICLADNQFYFIWNYHHLLLDGWCLPLLLQEVFASYGAAAANQTLALAPVPPYRDYIVWQQQQEAGKAAQYWRAALEGLESTPLLFEGQAEERQLQLAGTDPEQYRPLEMQLPEGSTERLQHLARHHRLTLSTLVQGAWALTLSQYTRSTEVLFGYTVSGRSYSAPGAEQMIGLFINTLPVRLRLDLTEDWLAWLQQVQAQQLEREKHAHISLADIHSASGLARTQTFLETIIAFENYPLDKSFQSSLGGIAVQDITFFEQTTFPITLIITPGTRLAVKCLYDQRLYEASQIEQVLAHFRGVLEGMLAPAVQQVQDLLAGPRLASQQQLAAWNATDVAFDNQAASIHHLFERQARSTPAKLALDHAGQQLTYQQLNTQANQLAHYLRRQGAAPGQLVGLCLAHSAELVVSILAVLKTGAAYVPIDTAYPPERREFMLEDARCDLLLTQGQEVNAASPSVQVQVLADVWPLLAQEPATDLPVAVGPADLCYVMYTSGSSGKPKGVQIAHGALVNYIDWAARTYLRGRQLDFPLYTSIAFDLTVTSLFTPLVTGNAIRIYADDKREWAIERILDDNKVGIVKITPSHLKLIRDRQVKHSAIKCLIVGGEELETSLAADISRNFGGQVEIYNEYGPTEATVGCMTHRFDPAGDKRHSVPVGVPIQNTQIYLLNEQLQPVPAGVAGEVCIAGAGLAQGYLNRPVLTSDKFVANPSRPDQVLYRSGDLARFLPTGMLELLGRIDQQVKFRGYRIELSEIQAAMEAYSGVAAGAVQLLPMQPAPQVAANVRYCTKCGLPSNYPNVEFNEAGVCSVCVGFESYRERAHAYFKPLEELRALLQDHQQQHTGPYDCLVLLSGGKDSTYVLYQLVREMKLRVLVFTMDNGYISEEAKDNMRRVTQELGVELVFGATEAMNAIFVDSLRQFSNVCNGCFKTIYTLSANLAKQKGIKYIVTGLSRGQLYETRLNDLYCANVFDPPTIDKLVLQSRIEYHQKQDAVSDNLDVSIFRDEHVFEDIQFIDFYRYADVKLADLYAYLDAHAPWVRPSDTGRSTNCLINDVGIYIHQKEQGYHNYALPYAWDVRMGHKERAAALEELHDDLDLPKIRKILAEIGYDEQDKQNRSEKQLVAYYVAAEDIPGAAWRAHLAEQLPAYMVPTIFVRLDSLPLTANGKLNYRALPHPAKLQQQPEAGYVAPRNEIEEQLTAIWQEVLHRDSISVHDNIFDAGGHSLLMTLVYSRIIRLYGKRLSMMQMFEYPTIAALATYLSQPAPGPVEEEALALRADARESRRDAISQKRKARLQLRATDEDS